MKKAFLTIATVFIISKIAMCQLSIGIGAGSSNKAPAVQLHLSYNTKVLGVMGGYYCHLSKKVDNPAYFNLEIFKGFYSPDALWKFSPHAGAAFRMASTDKKELNAWKGIFGLEIGRIIGDNPVVFANLVFTDNTCFIFFGVRGVLWGRNCN